LPEAAKDRYLKVAIFPEVHPDSGRRADIPVWQVRATLGITRIEHNESALFQ